MSLREVWVIERRVGNGWRPQAAFELEPNAQHHKALLHTNDAGNDYRVTRYVPAPAEGYPEGRER